METVALDMAFEAAVEMMSDELHETLFIVTSDHGHTMSFAGYQARGTSDRLFPFRPLPLHRYKTVNYRLSATAVM